MVDHIAFGGAARNNIPVAIKDIAAVGGDGDLQLFRNGVQIEGVPEPAHFIVRQRVLFSAQVCFFGGPDPAGSAFLGEWFFHNGINVYS